MNRVDKALKNLDERQATMTRRVAEITGSLETLQGRRKQVAFAAHGLQDYEAGQRLKEIEAEVGALRTEQESLGLALQQLEIRRAEVEGQRAEVERLEQEYADREKVRLEACAALEAKTKELAPLITAYLEANRGQQSRAAQLEHTDALKHNWVADRLYSFLAVTLFHSDRRLRQQLGNVVRRFDSLTEVEGGKSLVLTKPEMAPVVEEVSDNAGAPAETSEEAVHPGRGV